MHSRILSIPFQFAFLLTYIKCGSAVWRSENWNSRWDEWWHYKQGAIGGPDQWGQTMHMVYKEDMWPSCAKGRRQSPVNISVDGLIYDHMLTPLRIEGHDKPINLRIENSGQDVNAYLESGTILFAGGPLSYEYEVFGFVIKFGSNSRRGSDHWINGAAFAGELQFYAFNSALYKNYSHALSEPNGLAAVAVFLIVGEKSTEDLSAVVSTVEKVKLRGDTARITGLLLKALLPATRQYMTYEGSLPFPACHETVTWLVLNQPIEISETQLKSLRSIRMSRSKNSGRMADNFRPTQSLNNRSIRTNINMERPSDICSIRREFYYEANVPGHH